MKTTKLKLLCVLIAGLTIGEIAFAQHGGGINGPEGPGRNTDEAALTRENLFQILEDCSKVEMLEVARNLSKNPSLVISDLPAHIRLPSTVYEDEYTDFNFYDIYFQNPGATQTCAYGSAEFSNSFTFNFIPDNMTPNGVRVTAPNQPDFHYETQVLDGVYDEYGRIVQSKILIKNFKLSFPSDAKDINAIQFLNEQTRQPILGVTFNAPRYYQCVMNGVGRFSL